MKYLLFLSIFCSISIVRSQNYPIQIIYKNLYEALNLSANQVPKLKVTSSADLGASYSNSNNTIFIETKLLDGIQILGKNQDVAIAFILGHELCHALEKDKHDTYFLAYDKVKSTSYGIEQNADIQGAFVAYLAGYNCLPSLVETIETIYEVYRLESNLKGYPDKSERIESIYLIREEVESLVELFKVGNLLMLSEKYSLSAKLFERISQYIPSMEVLNNIGTNLFLEAMNVGKYNYFEYMLPIEIASDLRLKKPSLLPNQKEPDLLIDKQKEILLRLAENYFKNIISDHPDYFPAWNNLVCLKLYQKNVKNATIILDEMTKRFEKKDQLELLHLLNGISKLMKKDVVKAKSEFNKVTQFDLKQIANYNLQLTSDHIQKLQNCDIQYAANKIVGSPLLQKKTVKIDSLTITWEKGNYEVSTTGSLFKYELVNI
ncbi:MAG: hypothetical protein ABI844_11910, partial [Saprospiraceae bacterium]